MDTDPDFPTYDESEPELSGHSAFVRYTGFVILGPVVGVALHAPFRCAGVDLWRDSACLPPGRHPAHIEEQAPLLSTNVWDFRAAQVSSGASLSSSTAAATT